MEPTTPMTENHSCPLCHCKYDPREFDNQFAAMQMNIIRLTRELREAKAGR